MLEPEPPISPLKEGATAAEQYAFYTSALLRDARRRIATAELLVMCDRLGLPVPEYDINFWDITLGWQLPWGAVEVCRVDGCGGDAGGWYVRQVSRRGEELSRVRVGGPAYALAAAKGVLDG